MKESLIGALLNTLLVLGITIGIFGIWFVIWSMIRHPIRMKDDILKERDEARKELTQIQAAKGVEWDNYKQQQEELDKLRKAYFQAKSDLDKAKEEIVKENIQKDKLIATNKELKEEIKKNEAKKNKS